MISACVDILAAALPESVAPVAIVATAVDEDAEFEFTGEIEGHGSGRRCGRRTITHGLGVGTGGEGGEDWEED